MKVKELIEILKSVNPELEVYIPLEPGYETDVAEANVACVVDNPEEPNEECSGFWIYGV